MGIDETLRCDETPSVNDIAKRASSIKDSDFDTTKDGNYNVAISPNPTTGVLNISNSELIDTVSVKDLTGKTVYVLANINSNTTKINISKFNSGVYFDKTKTISGSIITKKVIKN